MLRMVLKLMVMQPQLLLTHANNYKAFLFENLENTWGVIKSLLVLYLLSTLLLGLSLISAIGSILLWAALPILNHQNAWLLYVLPVALLLLSILFYVCAKSYKVQSVFNAIEEQIKLDMLSLDKVYRNESSGTE